MLKENFEVTSEIILNRELEINTYKSYSFLLKLNMNKNKSSNINQDYLPIKISSKILFTNLNYVLQNIETNIELKIPKKFLINSSFSISRTKRYS